MTQNNLNIIPEWATAVLVLSDGSIFWGNGIGYEGKTSGEICFNTSMTGYQEILTDPSYAGQIINFTFPHIGNTGINTEDIESKAPVAKGLILRESISSPSNWRSTNNFNNWLQEQKITGISNIDTRALTHLLREKGAQNGLIFYNKEKLFDIESLLENAKAIPSLEGMDLAKTVSCTEPYEWTESNWDIKERYGEQQDFNKHIVVVDFGVKYNILRCLTSLGLKLTIVPCSTSAESILSYKPDGIFLSNGPGDPAATGEYAVPMIQELLKTGLPLFGICLGHQLLARALGGETEKMLFGHRGANHPVKDLSTNKTEITSQNHGFEVIPESLPDNVEITHISLFDKSNEGISVKGKPVFSVQYHPESSPGPHDSHYLFERFVHLINTSKQEAA